ncbi:MAG: pyruvate ferredoxin oxidoreductase [Candidatus Glassbacteria bacterium]
MEKVIEGTHAASYAAKLARVEVIAAYPITPSSSVVELLSEMCARGELKARFIKVESEHSAMASCIGAAAAGARAFTATSSHGLALMHEMLHWAAGGRLPIVMVNVNRAMGPPWTIWADQTDSLSQRDTGWMQYYCESNQEVLDTVLMSYKISEKVRMPSMLNLDAFFLSHTCEPVDIPDQEKVDEFLPPWKPDWKIDPADPHTFGGLASADYYMELRYMMERSMEEARDVIVEVASEFGERFGRNYDLIEQYMMDDAEVVLITAGTATSTARLVVEDMRSRGVPVGLLKMRVFRPFPFQELRRIASSISKVAVLDRDICFGVGGIFCQEVKAALCSLEGRPDVFGYVAGLGGRDITPDVIEVIIERTMAEEKPADDIIWIGAKL